MEKAERLRKLQEQYEYKEKEFENQMRYIGFGTSKKYELLEKG